MFAQLLVLLAIIVALLATVSEAWFYGGFGYPWYVFLFKDSSEHCFLSFLPGMVVMA